MIFRLFGESLRHQPDEALVLRLQAGEGRALEELYRRYGPPLLRYFYRMLWQDKARAEDAVHDVFVKIMERPGRIDAQRKFSTWLYSVAHNLCKNEYRKKAFLQASGNGGSAGDTLHGGDDLTMDHDTFRHALEKILDQEGEDARTILVLRHELEMSFAEIGVVINCPEGTVKSRLFYLRKRLALALEPYKTILEK